MARASAVAQAALAIVMGAMLVSANINVCVYSNTDVVESFERAGLIYETVRYLVPSHPSYSSSQPDFTGLGAFVIPGNKGSYWATEGLAANAAKRSALVDFVTGGGVLVLADGGSTGSNQFAPILDLFLGKPSGCVVDPITLPFLAYRRYADGRLNDLPSPIKVKPDQGVSTLVCPAAPNAKAVYTGWNPATKRSVSVATTWSFGKGVVVWIGSGYTQPNLKGYAELAAGVIYDTEEGVSSCDPWLWRRVSGGRGPAATVATVTIYQNSDILANPDDVLVYLLVATVGQQPADLLAGLTEWPSAYIIPPQVRSDASAWGDSPYALAEGLASDGPLDALRNYVHAGGNLALPGLLLGQSTTSPHVPYLPGLEVIELDPQAANSQALLVCDDMAGAAPWFEGWDDVAMRPLTAALMWTYGAGRITWIGAGLDSESSAQAWLPVIKSAVSATPVPVAGATHPKPSPGPIAMYGGYGGYGGGKGLGAEPAGCFKTSGVVLAEGNAATAQAFDPLACAALVHGDGSYSYVGFAEGNKCYGYKKQQPPGDSAKLTTCKACQELFPAVPPPASDYTPPPMDS
eukprot:XP_001699355.1 hydroxyproline-rich cell wall protein [Chlamydomonas reinhardtii]